jgi:hypothetical protein
MDMPITIDRVQLQSLARDHDRGRLVIAFGIVDTIDASAIVSLP